MDAAVADELRQLRESLVEKEEEGMMKKDELRQLHESVEAMRESMQETAKIERTAAVAQVSL